MTIEDYKKIDLIDFLVTLGHAPDHSRKSGNEIWFPSPFRKEKTPSFKVRRDTNRWYDFGIAKGGSILDLVSHLYNLSIAESIKHLKSKEIRPMPYLLNNIPAFQKNSPAELRSIKELQNRALVSYLQDRGINISIARRYVKEVYYRRNEKNFYAVGMENNSGGYEFSTRGKQNLLKVLFYQKTSLQYLETLIR